jgi:phosphate transport system protein
MAGYRREFDRTLEAIEAEVIELFAMIAEDLPHATAALLNGDGKALPALAEHQQAIDALYPQLEAKISWEIMRQAPVASDLRFLLSVLKIVRDFERAHRSVVHIAAPGPSQPQ